METKKSGLDTFIIKEIAKNKYGIEVLDIVEINRGTADIYKIKRNNKEYVLKVFTENRTKNSILKEVKIVDFLKKQNIRVPVYVKTIYKEDFTEYNGRIIILQEFIKGYTIENNTGNYQEVMESARLLGKLIKALEKYETLPDEDVIEKYFSKNRLEQGISKAKRLLENINNDNKYKEQIKQDLIYKIKISEELKENFDFNIINKMTMKNTHGDYSVQQLIYCKNKEPVVIDFEAAKTMPIVWEVIRSYSYIDKYAKNGELNIQTLKEYFKEFLKYVHLNKYDLKYASHIYLIQTISSVFGYKEYNDDYRKKELLDFAFFRTNLCKFLYENLKKISSNLESIDIGD